MLKEVNKSACYGKLVLLSPNGPCQEFELAKSSVFMGRMITNHIVLNDVRVSRNHAKMDCGDSGVILVDLGSSNGTRVNGICIERLTLKPDDTISLGSQQRVASERALNDHACGWGKSHRYGLNQWIIACG